MGTHQNSNNNSNNNSIGDGNGAMMKVVTGAGGYVLQDVPHFTDYIPDLPTYPNPLRFNPAYSVVKQYFVDMDDTVPQKVVVQKDSPRGIHFRRAGPRQKVYFNSDEVSACIVTCGGLCPGLNTVIREIVHSLDYMYGINKVLGIDKKMRIEEPGIIKKMALIPIDACRVVKLPRSLDEFQDKGFECFFNEEHDPRALT